MTKHKAKRSKKQPVNAAAKRSAPIASVENKNPVIPVVRSKKPYIIAIVSQKGGVGKTTIAVNLAIALALAGKSTLLVDKDLANPCVGIHLGMQSSNSGTVDVLQGKLNLQQATTIHAASGLRVVPAIIREETFYLPSVIQYAHAINQLLKSKYEYIIVDTEPGYITTGNLNLSKYLDEVLIVANPNMGSITSVMRFAHYFVKQKVNHNLVINLIRNAKYEFNINEIEDMYGGRAIAVIPEDPCVPSSISQHVPAYLSYPRSQFSTAIRNLSRRYVSKAGIPLVSTSTKETPSHIGFIALIKNLFGKS